MNPKEKAKELVDKYMYCLICDMFTAKVAALIFIEELLKEYCLKNTERLVFWKKVRQEIKNLKSQQNDNRRNKTSSCTRFL